MIINEYNCHVIYGWYAGLNQWHIAAIIPENFTETQTLHLKEMATAAVSLACNNPARVFYQNKGSSFPLFIQE